MENENKIVTVEQMRQSDAYTIEHFTNSKTLMYRAAAGIYNSFNQWNQKIAIICGSGNNGGDGYALACILVDNGIMAHIYTVSDKFSADGKYYYDMAKGKNVPTFKFTSDLNFEGYDVLVDCIFGTGFIGTPTGNSAYAIKRINESNAYVISADINSGLDANTGKASLAVKSDLTVSIGFYKIGMFQNDSQNLIGKLTNVDIGIVLI